ncbi:MAG TPA: YncE family protein [Dongiaceae bacterium]|nr:YncE family protein [Dongiaceae bacterium]
MHVHRSLRPVFALAALTLLAAGILGAAAAASPDSPFKILRRISLGGEGGWDYVYADPAAHRLYVSHGTRAVVVDTRTDSTVGEIAPAMGIHGIAVATGLGRGWTSNGRDSSVTVFDTKTLATTGTIKLPARNPDAIVYDPASQRVFTFNGGSGNATAIDANTGTIAGSVELGSKPEFAALDGRGNLWVNLEDSSAIVRIDTKKLAVTGHWSIAPGEGPSGLAFDAAHRRLFSVCGNKTLVVVDADHGNVVTTLPIGQGVDAAAYDARRGLVFASNGEGTLTVIRQESADRYVVVENAATERGARTMAIDESTGLAYLPTADFGPPPAPTPDRPHPRGSIVPGSFRILVVGR